MKKALFLPAIFASVFVISCGGKAGKDKEGLEGTWIIRRANGTMVEENVGTQYTFRKDTLILGQGLFENKGLTVITDSTFTFQAIGNNLKFDFKYLFNGDTLVVMPEKSNQVFHMIRK